MNKKKLLLYAFIIHAEARLQRHLESTWQEMCLRVFPGERSSETG